MPRQRLTPQDGPPVPQHDDRPLEQVRPLVGEDAYRTGPVKAGEHLATDSFIKTTLLILVTIAVALAATIVLVVVCHPPWELSASVFAFVFVAVAVAYGLTERRRRRRGAVSSRQLQ